MPQHVSSLPHLHSRQRYALPYINNDFTPSKVMIWTTYIFIFFVVLTGYTPLAIQVGGLNIRASQVFLPVVLIVLLKEGRRARPGQDFQILLAGLGLWAAFLFWTIANYFNYTDIIQPIGHVGLTGLNLIQALAAYLLIVRTKRTQGAAIAFVASVTFFNILLLIVSAANALGFASFEGVLETESSPLLISGELTGGNIERFIQGVLTGNISVAALLIGIALILQPGSSRKALLWLVIAFSIVGVILGFSRQSLISAVGGLSVLTFQIFLQRRVKKLLILFVILIVVTTLMYVLSDAPIIRNYFQAFAGRALLLLDTQGYQEGTSADRIQMWSGMLGDFLSSPLTGSGQDAYVKYYPSVTGTGSHSFPIEILHATGLSGFLPYVYMNMALFLAGFRVLRMRSAPDHDLWLVAGILAAFVAVFLASFTNLIFWGPQYWLLFGFAIAVVRLAHLRRRSQSASSPVG